MPPRDWKLRLRDILDSIAAIRQYTMEMDFEAFQADRKTVDAVVCNITVIGEAAGSVPVEVRDAHREVPWKLMRDFRNVVVHAYFGIDRKIVWDTVQNDLPPLVLMLQRIITDATKAGQ